MYNQDIDLVAIFGNFGILDRFDESIFTREIMQANWRKYTKEEKVQIIISLKKCYPNVALTHGK